MEFAGIDSKKFVRSGRVKDFVALIGICVIVDDYSQFRQDYKEIMEELLRKRGIPLTKIVYKSHELNKLNIDSDFYKEFYDSIKNKIKRLYICYSYFSTTNPVEIFPFDYKKSISVIDFLVKHLDSSYPHICLWELSKEGFKGYSYLDGINGKITNAWKSIEKSKDFFILPNGDKTNALISSADILITFLDNILLEKRKKLNETEIRDVLLDINDKVNVSFVSNACLYSIIPLSEKQNIPFMRKVAHPTVYILKEKEKYVDENAIENSPVLRKISNFCFKKNGCYKFFDPKVDYEFLSSEDYLVAFGDDVNKSIEYFKKMGYQFKDISMEELDNAD
ncbi:MAG: hypothetical protein NTZ83_01835 [Candidatus Pacearchaeota archaeon]|nr:hypothetical protein [Candidatus Pacearchaeota archaeon]